MLLHATYVTAQVRSRKAGKMREGAWKLSPMCMRRLIIGP